MQRQAFEVEPACQRTKVKPMGLKTTAELDRDKGVEGETTAEGPELHNVGRVIADQGEAERTRLGSVNESRAKGSVDLAVSCN